MGKQKNRARRKRNKEKDPRPSGPASMTLLDASPFDLDFVPPLPTVKLGKYGLSTGLHLLLGSKAVGKTVSALALYYDERNNGTPVTFHSLMEPRAPITGLAVPSASATLDPTGGGQQLGETLLNAVTWKKRLLSLVSRKGGKSIHILDGLSFLLSRLPEVEAVRESIGRGTYEKGLTPLDVLGVRLHDAIAREAGVVLITTLNTQLFPATDKLEGACEGQLVVVGDGMLAARDRSTRKQRMLQLDPDAVAWARETLGYEDYDSGAEFESENDPDIEAPGGGLPGMDIQD